jgi:hypothetical protein
MIPFIITLLISIIENEFFIYSMYIAFILGIYQLISFLSSLLLIKKLEINRTKQIFLYLSIVLAYFISCYLISSNYQGITQDLITTVALVCVPIILSLFWTYILESIKQEI